LKANEVTITKVPINIINPKSTRK